MSQLAGQDDEINLNELFAAIVYNWWIVAIAISLSVFTSAFYVFEVVVPEYEASTRFELLDGDDGSVALGQASGLAALAGINLPGSVSEADSLEDRILSRPFLNSIYEEAKFEDDPEYNWSLQKPNFVARLKALVFGTNEGNEYSRNDYLVMAISTLMEKMTIDQGDNGIIRLTVAHPDNVRAADLANIIVTKSLQDIFERERDETRQSLSYFADELSQVRSDLDAANAAVRDYAISNSLQSAEELARTSSQLAQVRRDLDAIDNSITAINYIRSGDFNGSELSQRYPVTTSLSFRRLLNLSSDPNNWVKPSTVELDLALQRLGAQKPPLISSFNALEARAKSSGAEALTLAALEREVEVQQTIYESVITQFEARSLFSGYERASGRIVEAAIAPKRPASPQKSLILMFSVILGSFLGALLVVFLRKGTFYTGSAVKEAFAISEVRLCKRSQLGKLDCADLTSTQSLTAHDILASFDDEVKIVSVLSTNSGDLAAQLSLSLCKTSTRQNTKTALLELSNGALKQLIRKSDMDCSENCSKFSVCSGVDLILASNCDTFAQKSEVCSRLSTLRNTYDRVLIILPTPQYGTAISRIFAKLSDASIVVAARGKTTISSVEAIRSVISNTENDNPLLVIV